MATGLTTLFYGKRVYYGDDGAMRYGEQKIDGKWYYFYADGSMAVSTKVDGYEVGADGARR